MELYGEQAFFMYAEAILCWFGEILNEVSSPLIDSERMYFETVKWSIKAYWSYFAVEAGGIHRAEWREALQLASFLLVRFRLFSLPRFILFPAFVFSNFFLA